MTEQQPNNFDPNDLTAEFNTLKQFRTMPSPWLTAKEKRGYSRQSLEQFKSKLDQRQQQIEDTVGQLVDLVAVNPNVPKDELLKLAEDAISRNDFSETEASLFRKGLVDFIGKDKLTASFLNTFAPKDLFKFLFAQEPEGAVVACHLPASLVMLIFNKKDYNNAFPGYMTTPDIVEGNDRQASSYGAVLNEVGIEALNGSVIICDLSHLGLSEIDSQNYSNFDDWHVAALSNPDKPRFLSLVSIMRYDFECNGKSYRMESGGYDESTQSVRLLVSDSEKNIIANITVTARLDDSGQMTACFRSTDQPDEIERLSYAVKLEPGEAESAEITFEQNGLNFRALAGEWKIKWKMPAEAVENIFNNLKPILDHEEQHILNGFFIAIERDFDSDLIIDEAKRKYATFSEAKNFYLFTFLSKLRSTWLNMNVREEIIAYYADGESTAQIETTLTTNSLYDFKNNFGDSFNSNVLPLIRQDLVTLRYHYNSKEPAFTDTDQNNLAKWYEITFGEEYHKILKKWLKVITQLEQNGYDRQKIIDFLYTKDIRYWNISADRRFREKKDPETSSSQTSS